MDLINCSSFQNSVLMFMPHQLIDMSEDKFINLSVKPTTYFKKYMHI